MCVCMCAVGNFRATGFPHQTPSVSSLFYSFLCLLTCSSVGFFAPFFHPLLKEKKEGGKKIEQEMRKGPFFSFFHPTLSISVSRLKSLIEVLQPASRPATRRKKKVYRSKPVVGLLLYHSISSSSTSSLLYKLLFFSLLLSTEPPVRPNRFFSYPKPDPYYY